MNIEEKIIKENGWDIPSILIQPLDPMGAAVIVHGYGGCKEEQLGLSWRVAKMGIAVLTIDLRGHGEHTLSLDENVVLDVEAAVNYMKSFGKVAAIGHSLGGRLCLLSSADYKIGLSPALNKDFSDKTRDMINFLRGYRVRKEYPDANFDILRKLPLLESSEDDNVQIIYGSRDVAEIISASNDLLSKGVSVVQIDKALHSDIFLLEETFEAVVGTLGKWFKK